MVCSFDRSIIFSKGEQLLELNVKEKHVYYNGTLEQCRDLIIIYVLDVQLVSDINWIKVSPF